MKHWFNYFCFLGLDLFIFTTYGVGDQPPEFDENNVTLHIMVKDEEISALKDQLSFLRNRGKNGREGAVLKSADSWRD